MLGWKVSTSETKTFHPKRKRWIFKSNTRHYTASERVKSFSIFGQFNGQCSISRENSFTSCKDAITWIFQPGTPWAEAIRKSALVNCLACAELVFLRFKTFHQVGRRFLFFLLQNDGLCLSHIHGKKNCQTFENATMCVHMAVPGSIASCNHSAEVDLVWLSKNAFEGPKRFPERARYTHHKWQQPCWLTNFQRWLIAN